MPRTSLLLGLSMSLTGAGAWLLGNASLSGSPSATERHWGAAVGAPAARKSFRAHPAVARPAPAWKNTSWLNADQPITLESLRGRVVLLNFWVFTCSNCTNTVPSLVEFDRRYRDQGLTIIGIHTPEFPPYAGEHDRANVEQAMARQQIRYPVAQDNDEATWNLYGIRFWPSIVLIDKQGRIRYEGAGEFHLDDATFQDWEGRIKSLLEES